MNITVHKQIIDLLEGSGTRGMTLNVSISFFFQAFALIMPSSRNSLILCVISINELSNCF